MNNNEIPQLNEKEAENLAFLMQKKINENKDLDYDNALSVSKQELDENEKKKNETIEKLLETINCDDPKQWSLNTFKAVFNFLQEFSSDDMGGYTLVCQSTAKYMKHHSTGELSNRFAGFWNNRQITLKDGNLYAYGEEIKEILDQFVAPKLLEDMQNFKRKTFSQFPADFYKDESSFQVFKNIDIGELFQELQGEIKNIGNEFEKYLQKLVSEVSKSLPGSDAIYFYKSGDGVRKLSDELNIGEDNNANNRLHKASHIIGTIYASQSLSFTDWKEINAGRYDFYGKSQGFYRILSYACRNCNSLVEMKDELTKRGYEQDWKKFIEDMEKIKNSPK